METHPDWLCHCDLHPGNVIMMPGGPETGGSRTNQNSLGMMRAPAALDLAVCDTPLGEILQRRSHVV